MGHKSENYGPWPLLDGFRHGRSGEARLRHMSDEWGRGFVLGSEKRTPREAALRAGSAHWRRSELADPYRAPRKPGRMPFINPGITPGTDPERRQP